MYRCKECLREYTECPEFCDCGNDVFEEIVEEKYKEPVQRQSVIKKRKLSKEEQAALLADQEDKKKALITIGISLLICAILLVLPPYKAKKTDKVQQKIHSASAKIPDVNTYWDNTLPSQYRKKDANANLPVLNKNFGRISSVLRNYIVQIGTEFDRQWEPDLVNAHGECRIEFTINKEGVLNTKKMILSSQNEVMDDSVLILLSKITGFDVPPDDYKGEKIILAFKIDKNKSSKVYFPTN